MDDEEPHEHVFGPEDLSFTYEDIQKGYANVELLLRSKVRIREAMECYNAICETPAAKLQFEPENSAERLRTSLRRLRTAAASWQKAPDNHELQRAYASLARMACDDAVRPLAVVDEVANVLRRYTNDVAEPDSTMAATTGISFEQAQRAYATMHRIRTYLADFAGKMDKVTSIGYIGVGKEADSPIAQRFLGRPVYRDKNPNFETEALFFTISGLLHSEKDIVLAELGKIEPPREAERLRAAFARVSDDVMRYATFALDDPMRAVALLQADIPDGLEAIEAVKKRIYNNDSSPLDLLMESLRDMQSKASSRTAGGGS